MRRPRRCGAVPCRHGAVPPERRGAGGRAAGGHRYTRAGSLTLWTMDNYKLKYAVGSAYHIERRYDQGNAGNWGSEAFTVEDSALASL